jgi:hypothetical protein
MLRRIFGPKRGEATGGWRTQDNEELHNLYASPSIIRVIKLRRISWTGRIARMYSRGLHIGFVLFSKEVTDKLIWGLV